MTDWMERAECRRHDAELWHDRTSRPVARHICLSHCPVLLQCRTFAHNFKPRRWAEQVIGGEVWVNHRDIHKPATHPAAPSSVGCGVCRRPS